MVEGMTKSSIGSIKRGLPAGLLAVALALAGCDTADPVAAPAPSAPAHQPSPAPPAVGPPKPPELPFGGRSLFPERRVVAFYGSSGGAALGVLGETPPEQAGPRLLAAARPFKAGGKPVVPAFELIATVANDHPGPGGLYRTRIDQADVSRYLRAVRKLKGLLIIDVQPGGADFLDEVRHYERFLREPDVGIALDPEWSMGPGEVPGRTIGHTDAATVNRVSAYVARIVARDKLPEKLFIVHQFTRNMVRGKERLAKRPGLAMTFHVDGFGSQADKRDKYRIFTADTRWHHGFKLFYDEDEDLMTPAEALGLRPRPDLVTYQ